MKIKRIYSIVALAIMATGQVQAQEQTQMQEQVRAQEAATATATAEPIYVINGRRADVFDVRAVDMAAFKEVAKPKKSDFAKAGITAEEAAGREVKFLKSKNPLTLAKAGDMVEYTGQIQTEYGFGASGAKVYTEYGRTQAGGTAFLRVKPASRIVVGKEGYAPVLIKLGKTPQRTITLYRPSEEAVDQGKEDDKPTAEQKKVKATYSLTVCDSAGNPIEGATIYTNRCKKPNTVVGKSGGGFSVYAACGTRAIAMPNTRYAEPVEFTLGSVGEVLVRVPLKDLADGSRPMRIPDAMPTFRKEGLAEFREYIASQIKYPQSVDVRKTQGKVMVKFTVQKDGTVGKIKILSSDNEAFSAEVVRVLKASPRWKPAVQYGRYVNVYFTMPILFKWRDSGTSDDVRGVSYKQEQQNRSRSGQQRADY